MNCPNCGFPVLPENESRIFGFESKIPSASFLRDRKPRQPNWKRTDFQDFNFGEGLVIPAGTQYTRSRPARNVTMQSDVSVPAVQSVITGLLVGIAAVAICFAADSPYTSKISLVCAIGAGCITWFILSFQYHKLLWDTETITNHDLDGDGEIGQPTTTRIEVDITDDKRKRTVILNLEISQDKLVTFAKGILAGKSTSESTWVGKLFSPAEYNELRDELIARGLAEWRNRDVPQQGWKLTLAGMAVFRKLTDQ